LNKLERVVFPFFNTKLNFSQEIEAHKTIHAGLDELLATIRAAKNETSLFNAKKLKEMMEKLRVPLVSIYFTGFSEHL